MKLLAHIQPSNPMEFEQLELAVDRELLALKGKIIDGITIRKICEHGTLYLEFDGLSDEQSASIQQNLEWQFGQVKAGILWI